MSLPSDPESIVSAPATNWKLGVVWPRGAHHIKANTIVIVVSPSNNFQMVGLLNGHNIPDMIVLTLTRRKGDTVCFLLLPSARCQGVVRKS
jgi:hypothetical protein